MKDTIMKNMKALIFTGLLMVCGMSAAKSGESWCKRFLSRQHARYASQYDRINRYEEESKIDNTTQMTTMIIRCVAPCIVLNRDILDTFLEMFRDSFEVDNGKRKKSMFDVWASCVKDCIRERDQLDHIFEAASF